MTEKKITTTDLLKWGGSLLGGLGVFITTSFTTLIPYQQSVYQRLDEKFRTVVEKLSLQNREERLAAATNMGTFIKKGILLKGKYYNEAVDILINRLYTELDYNVLNTIKGSLQKMGREGYGEVTKKLSDINRSLFLQEYPLRAWRDGAKEELETSEAEYSKMEELFKENKSEVNGIKLDNLKKEIQRKREIYYDREKNFKELELHKQVIADFITTFLEGTKEFPVEGLEFYQISLNHTLIIGLNLSNSIFERSALSSSRIEETKFDGSTIIDTVFTYSILTKSSFLNCNITASLFDHITSLRGVSFSKSEFKDVFFAGSDLTGAMFKEVKGLLPIYFYEAKNIDKAKFDDPEFKKKVDEITKDEFKGYVNNSELADYRKEQLFRTLDELKKKEPAKATIEPFETLQEPKETK